MILRVGSCSFVWRTVSLAEKAEISKSILFQLETSEAPNPSLETLQKIAKALGVTLAALLEKGSARAKRVMPDRIDDALKEMIGDLRRQKLPVNKAALDARDRFCFSSHHEHEKERMAD
jgi:transcriptional regulator with XRE-family HTH domain